MQTTRLLTDTTMQLNEVIEAQADSSGNASFLFPAPPQGTDWTGTLNCPAAPVAAVFNSFIGATPWGEWGGNTVFGPIQAHANQQLKVTVTGLLPNTQYLLSWIGSADPQGTVQPVAPDANASALSAEISGTVIAQAPIEFVLGTTQVVNAGGFLDNWVATAGVLGFRIRLFNLSGGPNNIVVNVSNTTQGGLALYTAEVEVSGNGVTWINVPLAANPGDTMTFNFQSLGGTSPTIQIAILALGANVATATSPGVPLSEFSVGGTHTATVAVGNGGNGNILVAPPTGMAYRVHSFMQEVTGTGGTSLLLAASGARPTYAMLCAQQVYAYLGGQIVTTGLSVSNGSGAVNQFDITYDLISLPVLA